MNENSVITKTRRRKLCMAASDPEKPLAVITHVAFGNGGVNESGEPLVPLETQTALNSELARYEVESVTYPAETTARYAVTIPKDAMVGEEINEAALVDSDGDVVAIKTMYPKKSFTQSRKVRSIMRGPFARFRTPIRYGPARL